MPIASAAVYEVLRRALVGVGVIIRPSGTTALTAAPSITAGSGAASEAEPNGSVYLRTNGDLVQRISGAWSVVLSGGRAARVAAPFKSTLQTGTGSAQNVLFGFSFSPSLLLVLPYVLTGGAYVVTEGTHTSTNVVVTVTNGEKFIVLAYA